MLPYQLLLLLIILSVAYGLFGSKENITVVGKFNCGENHYPDVKIELWDAKVLGHWDALIWRGNKLETTYTDESGRFQLNFAHACQFTVYVVTLIYTSLKSTTLTIHSDSLFSTKEKESITWSKHNSNEQCL
ncbi:unnamed protein product [Onchocerca flexuosa]|uniref:Transthyretin-like family protein n=1 Tax=Onchocerca flexuosa TaxID=387005 RepID=A0A183I6S0_9BILA|nr:unnamed protein product [Onchocerca flexuosa]